MSAMGVRYALGDQGFFFESQTPKFLGEVPDHVPMQPLPMHIWRQSFSIAENIRLEAIAVRLATYGKSKLPGTVLLRLHDAKNESLAVAEIEANRVEDNAMSVFKLPKPLELASGVYSFDIQYQDGGSRPLTAWYTPANASNCALQVDHNDLVGCLDMQLMTKKSGVGHFEPILSKGATFLLENKDVPSGPYFVSDLHDLPGKTSSDDVVVRNNNKPDFVIEYRGERAGFIVLPMYFGRGWKASLNGAKVKPEMYLGGLPAFRVIGKSTLYFFYRPISNTVGKWISLSTALALLLLLVLRSFYVGFRNRRESVSG
jgi:hypothetical protein